MFLSYYNYDALDWLNVRSDHFQAIIVAAQRFTSPRATPLRNGMCSCPLRDRCRGRKCYTAATSQCLDLLFPRQAEALIYPQHDSDFSQATIVKNVKAAMGTAVTCELIPARSGTPNWLLRWSPEGSPKGESSGSKHQISRNKGVGSSGRTRTCSPSVNSRMLYH